MQGVIGSSLLKDANIGLTGQEQSNFCPVNTKFISAYSGDIVMSVILSVIELAGTIAFAISGTLTAIQKQLDLFGVLILSVVTAMGGGAIRDVFLGYTPPRMFFSYQYIVSASGVAVILFFFFKYSHQKHPNLVAHIQPLYVFCDALGLGIFSVTGTDMGIASGYMGNLVLCIFLGTITGVGGGILRDIMCSDIPTVLCRNIYAVAAILGSGIFYLMSYLNCDRVLSSLLAIFCTTALRLLAWHYHWNLPRITGDQMS